MLVGGVVSLVGTGVGVLCGVGRAIGMRVGDRNPGDEVGKRAPLSGDEVGKRGPSSDVEVGWVGDGVFLDHPPFLDPLERGIVGLGVGRGVGKRKELDGEAVCGGGFGGLGGLG
jgi:hypothetical protein